MAAPGKKKGKKKKKKVKATVPPISKYQRFMRKTISSLFESCDFQGCKTQGIEIKVGEQCSELDYLYFFNRVVIFIEDTTTKSSSDIGDHINKKGVFFTHAFKDKSALIAELRTKFPLFNNHYAENCYTPSDIVFRYIYSSYYDVSDVHLTKFEWMHFLSKRDLLYFRALTKVVGKSARYELYKFAHLTHADIEISHGETDHKYPAYVLPETPSGFPKDFKLVTFYMEPEKLIPLSYVLRKDSWQDSESLYQRMLIRAKIRAMRRYLADENRVFINNVIVSLSPDTKFVDNDGSTVAPSSITNTLNLSVSLPTKFNSIGIIDGQHRVFSYHEGSDTYEPTIRLKRKRQQLLVTGVVFPSQHDGDKRTEFEAKLFLEINDKQSRTKSELRQSIQTIVEPFTQTAIARSVIAEMSRTGPLAGVLKNHAFDDGILKTVSIVSYGLSHLVKISSGDMTHSLFSVWPDPAKQTMESSNDLLARKRYVDFCVKELNEYILAFRETVSPSGLWTTDKKISRVLTTTTINGLLFAFRAIVSEKRPRNKNNYLKGFKKLTVKFTPAHFKHRSSHWKALGEAIFKQCFGS